ncbi:MAG: signal peptidase I [bacterium]
MLEHEENSVTVPDQPQEHQTPPSTKQERFKRLKEYLKTLLITLCVAFILKLFVVEAFRIPSGSMEDTLLVGDFLLVNKLVYGIRTPRTIPLTNMTIPSLSFPKFRNVQRGDVIVFEYPGEATQRHTEMVNYIKRCIGLPGDTIEMVKGRVFINGKELINPRTAKPSAWEGHSSRAYPFYLDGADYTDAHYGPLIVPKRGDSIELTVSNFKHWKPFIEREGHRVSEHNGRISIDGVQSLKYLVHQDYYFALGDNRGNSLDSRFWGFIPDNYLLGEALVVYWSWDPFATGNSIWDRFSNIRWNRIGTVIH